MVFVSSMQNEVNSDEIQKDKDFLGLHLTPGDCTEVEIVKWTNSLEVSCKKVYAKGLVVFVAKFVQRHYAVAKKTIARTINPHALGSLLNSSSDKKTHFLFKCTLKICHWNCVEHWPLSEVK